MTTNEKLDKLFESHGTPLSQRYDDPVARYGKDPLNKKENNVVYRQEIKKLETLISNSMKTLTKLADSSAKIPGMFDTAEDKPFHFLFNNYPEYSEFGMILPEGFKTDDLNNAQIKFLSSPRNRRIFYTHPSYYQLEPSIVEELREANEGNISIFHFEDYFQNKDLVEYYKILDKLFNYGIVNALTKWQKAVFDLYNGINGLLGAARESYGEECSKFMYDYICKKYPTMTWFQEEDWDM